MTAPLTPDIRPIRMAPANEALTADLLIAKSIALRPAHERKAKDTNRRPHSEHERGFISSVG